MWKVPLGLDVLFFPTATGYTFKTLPSWTSAILRAGIFTISRRVGAVSAAISVAAATRIAKNLMVCIAFFSSSQKNDAGGYPVHIDLILNEMCAIGSCWARHDVSIRTRPRSFPSHPPAACHRVVQAEKCRAVDHAKVE